MQSSSNTGNATTAHLRYAEELRDAVLDAPRAASRDPLGANTLVYATQEELRLLAADQCDLDRVVAVTLDCPLPPVVA